MTLSVFRTHISLTVDDRALLKAESARTGLSISALIRDAIRRAYGATSEAERDVQAISSVAGTWRDRASDGKAYVDALRSARRFDETSNNPPGRSADLNDEVDSGDPTASVRPAHLPVLTPKERSELLALMSSKYGDGFKRDDVQLARLREGWPE
ncbi:ribbon-helix-helix protein, CopG family [Leifsonia sp. NPDC056665]|uniref:ribbon-helix-helix protein, CopG family n=1 Tax=Leifsonia sp. NPDC056665 TaxID=3345901 RepID=UPI0036BB95F5